MDRYPPDHFATIIQIAQTTFTHVVANIDMTPSRTLVRIQAQYGRYRVFITELMDQTTRKYRSYILDNHIVAVGFDNSPDPRALLWLPGACFVPQRPPSGAEALVRIISLAFVGSVTIFGGLAL